jgi:hypothetical protein
VTLALTGNTTSGTRCLLSADAGVLNSLIAVDRKSMVHTVAERSYKDADFLCISCI